MYLTAQRHIIPLNLRVKVPCMMSSKPPALSLVLMRVITELSSNQPFILLHSSHTYGTFGQVLWHELANPVPRANKFSLCSRSFHGNLISSTLTALSSFLAGFFSGCSSPLRISSPLFLPFLKAHIHLFLNHNPFKGLSITQQQQMELQAGTNV